MRSLDISSTQPEDPRQEVPDTHTIMSLVGAGAGIGFVPASAGHIKLPGVVLVPVPEIPPVPLALAWREDDTNPALQALIDLLSAVSAECRHTDADQPQEPIGQGFDGVHGEGHLLRGAQVLEDHG